MNITGYKYTDKETKLLLKSLVILIDTREKMNSHIISGIQEQGLKWQIRVLQSGDYSCMLPKCAELQIFRDIYFDKQIFIERKNSLEELSVNLAQERYRFENEMLRAKDSEKHLIVENGSWERIINGDYFTGLKAHSYYRSLMSFTNKYGLIPHFISSELAAKHISNLLGIHVKNWLESR